MIGQILKQRYQVLEKLGEGGIGETFLAEDLDIPVNPKLKCVVKRLQPLENTKDLATLHRLFEQEAQILYQLGQQHPHIPQLYAYFQEDQDFYLIQEYIEGQELIQEMIADQPWTEQQTIDFLTQILTILSYVHRNQVIHRDIKPQNIMRRKDGKLILIDFGSVKQVSTLVNKPTGLTQRTVIIGTKEYMPSEQAMGKPKFSSDIYAVGMIAIQGITGNLDQPFPENIMGEIEWQAQANINPSLSNILSKMVRYDFRERYQDATEALEEVKQFLSGKVIPSTIPSPSPPTQIQSAPSKPAPTKLSTSQETPSISQSSSPLSWIKNLLNSPKPPENTETDSAPESTIEEKVLTSLPQSEIKVEPIQPEKVSKIQQFIPQQIEKKWGYVNQDQKVIILPQFDEADAFYEGIARVKMGDKWGYIDQQGSWIMSPKLDGAENFQDGLAKITLGDKSGYINKEGKL
ncbi:MAG: WG repeat-containing protein, partial [Microcystaceae cyanobacterium]